MAPTNPTTVNTRKTKGGKTIFGLLRKFKISKRNNDVEKQNQKHELEFDALPDQNEREKQPEEQPQKDSNRPTYEETPKPSDFKNKFNFSSASYEEEENHHDHRPKSSRSNTSHSDHKQCFNQKINAQVNGGSYFQIGDTTYNINNLTMNGGLPNHRSNNSVKKTREILALFKCRDEIERAHLQYLSEHFGEHWEQIGKALGFSAGELNEVKRTVKEREDTDYDQERGFQMLMKWRQLQEEEPTVGTLAEALWATEVNSAQEAVKRLSLDIEHFRDS